MYRLDQMIGELPWKWHAVDMSDGNAHQLCLADPNRALVTFTASSGSGISIWERGFIGTKPGMFIVVAGTSLDVYWERHNVLCSLEWWGTVLANPLANTMGVLEVFWRPTGELA